MFLYGGLVFIRGAQGELADRQPGMMTLISLAIIVAFGTSWAGTLGLFDVEIWWELATLITMMLLGHWLEMRSIAQARGPAPRWRSYCPRRPNVLSLAAGNSSGWKAYAHINLGLMRNSTTSPQL